MLCFWLIHTHQKMLMRIFLTLSRLNWNWSLTYAEQEICFDCIRNLILHLFFGNCQHYAKLVDSCIWITFPIKTSTCRLIFMCARLSNGLNIYLVKILVSPCKRLERKTNDTACLHLILLWGQSNWTIYIVHYSFIHQYTRIPSIKRRKSRILNSRFI